MHADDPTPQPSSQPEGESTEFADTLMRELAAAPAVAVPAHHVLGIGARVAQRYRIESVLGKGGMGTVFAATDERLGRRVALKVHHGRTASIERLRQEARVLARLSHPNVVTVMEVGTHDGQLYVVMEYVDGPNGRAWASQRRGDVAAIIGMYLQAAQGLAAAHALGIVHRDFKPDNVLVGADGRARVADFGLAAALAVPDEFAVTADAKDYEASLIETHEGTTLGTPAYIAPEQIGHSRVDARADQFSFCASLFEALHGELPFRGASAEETMAQILAGHMIDRRAREVPAWLDGVLRRGLARDPSRRFADMDSLVRALRRGGNSRLRRALGLGVAGIAVGAWMWMPQPAPRDARCDEDPRVEWDDARRRITATVEHEGSAALTETWQRLSSSLGSKGDGVVSARDTACEVEAEKGSAEHDTQLWQLDCITRVRGEIGAFYDELGGADLPVMVSLLDDALTLEDASGCLVVDVATAQPATTDSPETASVRLSLATLEARMAAGGRASLLPFADEVVRAASATERSDLLAAAFAVRGRLRALSGDEGAAAADLEASIEVARANDEHRIVVRAASTMATLAFNVGRDLSEVDRWIALGRSHIRRWPEDAEATVRLLTLQSAVHRMMNMPDGATLLDEAETIARSADLGPAGQVLIELERAKAAHADQDYGTALRHLDAALEHARDAFGPVNPHIEQALYIRATIYDSAGNYDEVRRALREALEIHRALTLEADHAALNAMIQLANMEALLGNGDDAVALCEEVRSAHPSRNPAPEMSLQVAEACGLAKFTAGRLDEAHAEYTRALTVLQNVRADYDARGILGNLSLIERSRGRLVEAKQYLDQALRVQDALDREDPSTPDLTHTYGFLLFDMGEYDQAEVMFQRAAGQVASILGPDHVDRGWPELGLGRVALQRGDAQQAIAHLEEALAAFGSDEAGPMPRAEVAVTLAEALRRDGQSDRAREVATAALADLGGPSQSVTPGLEFLRDRLIALQQPERKGPRRR